VVHLVETVDHSLVADRHVPLEHVDQDHVLHSELPRSTAISGPIQSINDGAFSGPARLTHTQPPPLVGSDHGRTRAGEVFGIEVDALRNTHHLPVVS
jgi:hypothetical protein